MLTRYTVVDFYNQINLLYGAITEFCSPQSCPEMKATDECETRESDVLGCLLIERQVRVSVARLRELQAADQDAGTGLYRAADELGPEQHR